MGFVLPGGNAAVLAAVAALLAGLALATAVLALGGLRRARARTTALEAAAAAQRRELEAAAGVAARTLQLLARLNAERTQLQERLQVLERRGGAGALDEAIAFARRGGAPAGLRARFGLSRGEAELVTRLHARRPRAPAA